MLYHIDDAESDLDDFGLGQAGGGGGGGGSGRTGRNHASRGDDGGQGHGPTGGGHDNGLSKVAALEAAAVDSFASYENALSEAVGEEGPNRRLLGLGSADETGVLDRATGGGRNGHALIAMGELSVSEEQVGSDLGERKVKGVA